METSGLVSKFIDKLNAAPPLGAVVAFDVAGANGPVMINARARPAIVETTASIPPDITLGATLENFEKLLNGALDPNFAYMTGKLKIRGPMKLALKISALLEDG
jgi:putative sterol carrier protein